MMTLIQVINGLVIECWPSDGQDKAQLVIHSLSQGANGMSPPGVLVVYAEEIRHLVAALSEASGVLAEYEAQR